MQVDFISMYFFLLFEGDFNFRYIFRKFKNNLILRVCICVKVYRMHMKQFFIFFTLNKCQRLRFSHCNFLQWQKIFSLFVLTFLCSLFRWRFECVSWAQWYDFSHLKLVLMHHSRTGFAVQLLVSLLLSVFLHYLENEKQRKEQEMRRKEEEKMQFDSNWNSMWCTL